METSVLESTIKNNLESILVRIEIAAQTAGRSPQSVRLVVVTKGHSIERIQAALAGGATRLGENYVEEALDKMARLPIQNGVEWHMIGHIQSRKARQIAEYFDFVHSLDSYKLAARLDRFLEGFGRRMPVLLECNVSGESSKYGFAAWDLEQRHTLLEIASQIAALPNLDLCGLMTMPPYFDDPETARPYFRELAKLRDYLGEQMPEADWSELSMGMSGDFEVAIQEGATLVRVGQAILGVRPDGP